MNPKQLAQAVINEKWHPTFRDEKGVLVGSVSISQPKRANKPPHLEPPYEYELSKRSAISIYWDLKTLATQEGFGFQVFDVETQSLERGRKIGINIRAFPPGYQQGKDGVTEIVWDEVTGRTKEILEACLGECPFYIEPWTPSAAFQARYTVYIQFTPN